MHRTSLSLLAGSLLLACAAGGDDASTGSAADDDTTSSHGGNGATGGTAAVGGMSAGNGGGGMSTGNGGSPSGTGGTGTGGAGTGGGGGMGVGGAGIGGAGIGGAGGGLVEDPPGTLLYEKVVNNSITDDFRRVRWHPSGAFALVLGTAGKLVRYDAGGGLTLVDTLGVRADDIDVAADGSFFMVVGTGGDTVGRMWRVAVDVSHNLTITEELTFSLGEPRAIERRADTWAVGAYSSDSISYLYLWDDVGGITVTKGFNAGAGFTDLMWGDPALLSSEVVHTGHGVNGADSKTYVVASDMVVSNNWSGGFGNAGGAGWRPGGTYGYFTGWSSNKLYVYNGSWSLQTLPVVGTAAAPQRVGWNATGTRALIVGRAIGPGLSATVIDHRAGASANFSASDLVYQSIPNFDGTPWFGTSSSYLNAVDWRPSSACAEGLIAADENPSFGLLIRYYDSSDPDC